MSISARSYHFICKICMRWFKDKPSGTETTYKCWSRLQSLQKETFPTRKTFAFGHTFGMHLIYGYYCLVPLQSVWSFVSSFLTDLFWILLDLLHGCKSSLGTGKAVSHVCPCVLTGLSAALAEGLCSIDGPLAVCQYGLTANPRALSQDRCFFSWRAARFMLIY